MRPRSRRWIRHSARARNKSSLQIAFSRKTYLQHPYHKCRPLELWTSDNAGILFRHRSYYSSYREYAKHNKFNEPCRCHLRKLLLWHLFDNDLLATIWWLLFELANKNTGIDLMHNGVNQCFCSSNVHCGSCSHARVVFPEAGNLNGSNTDMRSDVAGPSISGSGDLFDLSDRS